MTDSLISVVATTLLIWRPIRYDWAAEDLDKCAGDILAQIEEAALQTHEGRAWLADLNAKCGNNP